MANEAGKADTTKAGPQPGAKKSGWLGRLRFGKITRTKVIVGASLALVTVLAAALGLIGYGCGALESALFPRDVALLEHIPSDAIALVVIDPHKLDLDALGTEDSPVRAVIERTRADVKRAMSIDLLFDVDKIALTPNLAVARCRVSASKLEERLAESRYMPSEYKGVRYLGRAGEDAVAIRGSVLVYGDEAAIKGSIDAEANGTSLAKSDEVTKRLANIGWDHAVLVTVRVADERPSLRTIFTGNTGPRAVTAGASTSVGGTLDLTIAIEVASAKASEELAKTLEDKRAAVTIEDAKALVGEAAGPILVDLAKGTNVSADPSASVATLRLVVDPPTLDKALKVVAAAHLGGSADAFAKTRRLLELLGPSGN